jgi:arylsulfatase A-like enzyme
MAAIVAGAASAAESKRPSIVFILADDLGIGHVGCYGQKQIRTPNIDRLAAEGMKFTSAYAGANVCAPSRSTLMTGLHGGHTAVRNNGGARYLYDEDVTVAEVLKQAGYATGGFGKWGLGEEDTPGFPLKQGFDEWFGEYNQAHAHFYYPYFLWHNGQRYPLPKNEGHQRGQYANDEIQAKAIDFIRRHRAGPFFCYVPYILPHVELTVPDDSRREYEGKFPKKAVPDPRPGYIGSEDAYAEFAGMCTRLDRNVGEIMATLKELGIDDNTIVFFTSDNGPQPGEWTEVFVDYFDGNGPYRGAKTNFYEGGIREPFIARWPGHIAAGSQSDHLCAFYDMLPTLAELAGAQPPSNIDGISIVPTLLNRGKQAEHEYLFWEQPSGNKFTRAIHWKNWKLVQPKPDGKLELYDLASDLAEEHDVADQHPDVMAKMQSIIAAEHTPERNYGPAIDRKTVKDFVR